MLGVLGGAIIGGISGGVGAYAAAKLAPLITTAGGFLGGAVSGFIGGAVGGTIYGGFMSQLPGGDGGFWGGAAKGFIMGAVGGTILGGVIGGIRSVFQGKGFWIGKDLASKAIAKTISSLKTESVHDVAPKNNLSNQKRDLKSSDIVKEAIPDYGSVKYKAGYLKKVTGLDGQHNWNRHTIEVVADRGKVFNIIGGDQKSYTLIQHLGKHHGKSGIFELIIDNGVLTHQRFIPGGIINGIPNQVVPNVSRSVSPAYPWWK
ncbi:hypothetical protein [Tenacibaculum maritimum]|uniref:hypothetical protein n=1 Tax=Tenacibaculum maritimum TaxID=107401 RepID=UPI001F432F8B|nr:hypothetical protein [Tenacibaculum maritimum]